MSAVPGDRDDAALDDAALDGAAVVDVDPGFTTPALAAVWSSRGRVDAMVTVELALAAASARSGHVPADVAARIAALDAHVDDAAAVLAEGWERGTPVLPLLDRLRGRLDAEAAGWLHHGATSQDVLDTATSLQLRATLAAVDGDLRALVADLARLAAEHREVGARTWTLLQEAVPTTWGLRFATWLVPVVAHARRGAALAAELPVQLGGPTGGLPALDADGTALVAALADELGLVAPLVPWHVDRGPVERPVAHLLGVARTAAQVATSLALLAQQGEVEVRAGGSSSMPGKRNPVDAVRAVAAAEACAGAASTVLGGRAHELERAAGGWQAEWFALPMAASTAAAALAAVVRAVGSLTVTGTPPTTADGDGVPGRTATSGALVDAALADAASVAAAAGHAEPG